jgi:competence ComEA-like helix-hairpin-helix protein
MMKNLVSILIIFCSTINWGQQDTSSVEFIQPYFNAPCDTSFAYPNNMAKCNWDMIGVLVDQIDAAKYSVDLVAYDLQNMRIGEALARAARRGVKVRVITDVIHREHAPRFTKPMWDTLRANGIISFDDSGTIYWPDGRIESLPKRLPNSGANMHHKFAVIDRKSKDPNDWYIWTGTMNITYTGPWNTNATLLIKDSGIANAYFEEFTQMWGSEGMEPNPRRARFHKDKLNVSQNVHYVNDTKVEVYFGPMDRNKTKPSISERITFILNNYLRHDANFLAFAISSNIPISEALITRSARGEINLNGIIDPAFYSRYRNNNDFWARPEARFGNRKIMPGKEVRKLHSKTMILDAEYPYPEKHKAVTITGSYNFSKAAEQANDENILIIYSNEVANLYYQDFMGVMSRAKGESEHQFPSIDHTQWYDYSRVNDGQVVEVELATKFPYPVQLLGVKVPRMWAGHKDSTYFYAEEARDYLRKITDGRSLRIIGGKNENATHRYGKYHGYILAANEKDTIHVNYEMIKAGYGAYNEYYFQPEDSVVKFRKAEEFAKVNKLGIWSYPEKIGSVIQTSEAAYKENLFPLNINTASLKDLTFLPTVGPGRAEMIIKYREKKGHFKKPEDLERIKGIGPATVEKLKPLIIFEEPEETGE